MRWVFQGIIVILIPLWNINESQSGIDVILFITLEKPSPLLTSINSLNSGAKFITKNNLNMKDLNRVSRIFKIQQLSKHIFFWHPTLLSEQKKKRVKFKPSAGWQDEALVQQLIWSFLAELCGINNGEKTRVIIFQPLGSSSATIF